MRASMSRCLSAAHAHAALLRVPLLERISRENGWCMARRGRGTVVALQLGMPTWFPHATDEIERPTPVPRPPIEDPPLPPNQPGEPEPDSPDSPGPVDA